MEKTLINQVNRQEQRKFAQIINRAQPLYRDHAFIRRIAEVLEEVNGEPPNAFCRMIESGKTGEGYIDPPED